MLQEKWREIQKTGKSLFLCLNHSEDAKKEWLLAGGEEKHLLSKRQIESWLMLGAGVEFPRNVAYNGSLQEFVALFPKGEMERNKARLNSFLVGVVGEYENGAWSFFTCRAVIMGCCMGEYFSLANRKEV